jgi:hypothetical protein
MTPQFVAVARTISAAAGLLFLVSCGGVYGGSSETHAEAHRGCVHSCAARHDDCMLQASSAVGVRACDGERQACTDGCAR